MSEKSFMAKATLRKGKPRRTSYLEERLALWIGRSGLEQPIREFRFAPPRLWRFDFAWPRLGLAVEIEGGTYMRGPSGHGSGKAYSLNCEKYNAATLAGWRVFRVTVDMFEDGSVFPLVQGALTSAIHYVPTVLVADR